MAMTFPNPPATPTWDVYYRDGDYLRTDRIEASTAEAACAEAERRHGPRRYSASAYRGEPVFSTEPRYAPSRRANGTRWR